MAESVAKCYKPFTIPIAAPFHKKLFAHCRSWICNGREIDSNPYTNFAQAASIPDVQRKPSVPDLHRRPSIPDALSQAANGTLSRKPSSLADEGTSHPLKSTSSKSSLRNKAFDHLFNENTEPGRPGTPKKEEKEQGVSEAEQPPAQIITILPTPPTLLPLSVSAPATITQTPSPAPVLPSTPPLVPTVPPPPTIVPLVRMSSPPPTSRPQSPPSRAQSPSILKKDINRAQSPPAPSDLSRSISMPHYRTHSPHPRSHSPFLAHPRSNKSLGGIGMLQSLSSGEILQQIDGLLARFNSIGDLKGKAANGGALMEDPPRKLLLVSPVQQVVSKDAVKDRTLFLFSDLLIVAKCVTAPTAEGGLVMDKSFVVKNILELRRCRGPTLSMGSPGFGADEERRKGPVLSTFVEDFKKNPENALKRLWSMSGLSSPPDPNVVAAILFKTHELDRTKLGDYLARKTSRETLHAFVDKFGFAGTRIDHALRIFLLSILLSDEAETRSLENLLLGFSYRWFAANGQTVAFDRECAYRLVVSIVLLNASLHLGATHQQPPASINDFFGAVRAYDPRCSIKDDFLEDIYEAVKKERVSVPKAHPGDETLSIPVTIIGPGTPAHFTYRVKSELVTVRIPKPDPHFKIHLLGSGVLFEPPTLTFNSSAESSFRVTGKTLGIKSIVYWKAGNNASKYAMPLATEILIERVFMRNTLKLEVEGSTNKKSKIYVFSLDDPREYDHWAKVLKTRVDRSSAAEMERLGNTTSVGVPPRIRRAAEMVAFEVLKETLIGRDGASSVRSSPPESHIPKHVLNPSSSFSQIAPPHDSKNGQNGAGATSATGTHPVSSGDGTRAHKRLLDVGVISRDGHEITTLCVQNSLIPALISVLSMPEPPSDEVVLGSVIGNGKVDNLQYAIGSGIGRPTTPKAINAMTPKAVNVAR